MKADTPRCKTTQQNAHRTETIVCYRWHPWHGQTVRVARSMTKLQQALLDLVCDGQEHSSQREIPAWMVDAAA